MRACLFTILRQIAAWPWKLLCWLTLHGWLFICWHLMYDIFVRATVECNHGPFHGRAPSDCLQVLGGDHPSENIDCWTVSACVCIRRAALERNCKCLCVCLRVCRACLSPCTDGEIGKESYPEGKGHSPCKGKKGNSISRNTLLPNAFTLPSLCFPCLLKAGTYTYVKSS